MWRTPALYKYAWPNTGLIWVPAMSEDGPLSLPCIWHLRVTGVQAEYLSAAWISLLCGEVTQKERQKIIMSRIPPTPNLGQVDCEDLACLFNVISPRSLQTTQKKNCPHSCCWHFSIELITLDRILSDPCCNAQDETGSSQSCMGWCRWLNVLYVKHVCKLSV